MWATYDEGFGRLGCGQGWVMTISFSPPIIVSVVCPTGTGPHPPLRLARRPNRGHIGGGGWLRYYVVICMYHRRETTKMLSETLAPVQH